jgi:bifunctional non-homologous end joining protein LigD
MLATPWPRPFVDSNWAFELKWDGVRGILRAGPEADPTLTSRSGNTMIDRYRELAAFRPDRPLVLDGEVVALDAEGRPSFGVLQQRMGRTGGEAGVVPIRYAVFDILVDGVELLDRPWDERRARLERLELPDGFDLSPVVPQDPTALWELVEARNLEGIVAKRRSSPYRPGERSPDWRKISRFLQVRAVVGGYLPGERARRTTFGSLLLGLWSPDGLRWIGAVGSGFSNHQLRAIRSALDEMTVDTAPFIDPTAIPAGAVWVVPQLVAVVRYKEFTAAGRLRAPSFKGFTDEDPAGVTWEREGPGPSG